MGKNHVVECLSLFNDVLRRARLKVKQPQDLQEVVACCSSTLFLVDAILCILGRAKPNEAVTATTSNTAAIAASIDLAVRQLAQALEVSLDHISGSRICAGSMADILNLLELLKACGHQQDQQLLRHHQQQHQQLQHQQQHQQLHQQHHERQQHQQQHQQLHQQQHQRQQRQQQHVGGIGAKVSMSMPPAQSPSVYAPQQQQVDKSLPPSLNPSAYAPQQQQQQVLQLPGASVPQYHELMPPIQNSMAAPAQGGPLSDQAVVYAQLFADQQQPQPALVLASDDVVAAAAAAAAAVAALHGQPQPASAHGAAASAAAATSGVCTGGRAAAADDAAHTTTLLASLTDIIPMPEPLWDGAVGLVPPGQMPPHRHRSRKDDHGSTALGGAAAKVNSPTVSPGERAFIPPAHRLRNRPPQDSPSDTGASQPSASSSSASSLSFKELQQHGRHKQQPRSPQQPVQHHSQTPASPAPPKSPPRPTAHHQGAVHWASLEQQHPQPSHPEALWPAQPHQQQHPQPTPPEGLQPTQPQQQQQEQQLHCPAHHSDYHQHAHFPPYPVLQDRFASSPPDPQPPSAPPMPPTMPPCTSNMAVGPWTYPRYEPSYLPEVHSPCKPSNIPEQHAPEAWPHPQAHPADNASDSPPRPEVQGPLAYLRRLMQKVTSPDGTAGSVGEDAALRQLAAAALEAAQREGATGALAPQDLQGLLGHSMPGARQHPAGGSTVQQHTAGGSTQRRHTAGDSAAGRRDVDISRPKSARRPKKSTRMPPHQSQAVSPARTTRERRQGAPGAVRVAGEESVEGAASVGASALLPMLEEISQLQCLSWAVEAHHQRQQQQQLQQQQPQQQHHHHLQEQQRHWEAGEGEGAVGPGQLPAGHGAERAGRWAAVAAFPQEVTSRSDGEQEDGEAPGAAVYPGQGGTQEHHLPQQHQQHHQQQAPRSAALEQAQRLSAAAADMLQKQQQRQQQQQQQQQQGMHSSPTLQYASPAHPHFGPASAAPDAWKQPQPFHMGAFDGQRGGGRSFLSLRTKRPKTVRRRAAGGGGGGGAAARRAAAVHGAVLARPCLSPTRAKAQQHFTGRWAAARADKSVSTATNDHMALNRTLAAKLAYVNTLAHGSSHEAAVQVRLAAAALKEEDRRLRMRARGLLRQTAAEGRRDLAKQEGMSALEARAQAHSDRVEQLRLERLEAEFKAAEKARRERAAHRQEMAIRDAFLQGG
ncbi:hypothetical protein DUNSADRAFT_11065 [Dunaliella salina]|uniref:DUF5745 domain-containing protein n=1 Tax=Dunaliella salina TaxID=3046 RepID=A0ABQ7GE45_DUNSA|nr:hypothetical protein DUNSADRAFT_11065 [Dunaliella salina]|eukprot:KAF5832875.1 hypothetical protein DUNSADRAFT_11065 [Dunaliella salina]